MVAGNASEEMIALDVTPEELLVLALEGHISKAFILAQVEEPTVQEEKVVAEAMLKWLTLMKHSESVHRKIQKIATIQVLTMGQQR